MSDLAFLERLEKRSLNENSFNRKIEFLVDSFVPKYMLLYIYANGGNGKSYLVQALSRHLLDNKIVKRVIYMDLDNPPTVLKDRKLNDLLINNHKNLNYLSRSEMEITGLEQIFELEQFARAGVYDDFLLIVDSIRNLVDVKNDAKVMTVMDALMTIREAGMTIIVLGHENKDGVNYQGSNNILNSVDGMFRLVKQPSPWGTLSYTLEAKKDRAGIRDCAFEVDADTLGFKEVDYAVACMSSYELEFVEKIKKALASNAEPLNKTKLLELAGHAKDDKTAREALDKFTNTLWVAEKKGNRYFYKLK